MPSSSPSTSFVLAELRAREYRRNHEWEKAAVLASKAAEIALGEGDPVSWWNMTYLQGECLRDHGDFAGCAVVASTLTSHPVTAGFPVRHGQALILLAVALQGTGQLDGAIEAAVAAAKAVSHEVDLVDLRVQAQHALIAAWAESGRLEEAWQECRVLSRLISDVVDDQAAGKAYWGIGNVAFLRNQVEDGQHYHELAVQLFSPTKDLDLWAKFNKASAAMRLGAGIADAGTLRCIERAELATEIVGGSPEDHLLLATARAHWSYLTGDHDAAIGLLEPVCEQASAIAAQSAAEASYLLGRSLHAVGRTTEASARLHEAADYFIRAGAPERTAVVQEYIDEHF